MFSTYIARQAILDRNSHTIGYELLFRDSENNQFPEIDPDVASSKLIIQNHIHGDIQAISMGKLAFINFTEQCLINQFPLMFDPKSIVIELMGHSTTTERLVKIVKFYHAKGYKIALTEYDLTEQWNQIFPFITYLKVDIDKINPKRLHALYSEYKQHGIQLIAEKVETKHQLQSLIEVGFSYYQGFFYHEPEIVEGQTLAPIKTQMLNLMSETFKTPLDFDSIAEIISHDVNLSVGLLKMVNNVTTGARVEITSLKQAAAYLGEQKLRQFVSILALSKLTADKTDEAAKQALITAKLMSSLANEGMFKEISDLAFITGLLSSIEVILSMPMKDIVQTMPLAEPIKEALVDHGGLLGELLILTTQYITGQGENIDKMIKTYSLSADKIQQEFVAASQWCYDLNL